MDSGILNELTGGLNVIPVIINGNENIQSDLLILERTHHDNDMLEIIAPVNIKQVNSSKER